MSTEILSSVRSSSSRVRPLRNAMIAEPRAIVIVGLDEVGTRPEDGVKRFLLREGRGFESHHPLNESPGNRPFLVAHVEAMRFRWVPKAPRPASAVRTSRAFGACGR